MRCTSQHYRMVAIFSILAAALAFVNAQGSPKDCELTLNGGYEDLEPEGDPLIINARFKILNLRDVPDSGGSYSVDIM